MGENTRLGSMAMWPWQLHCHPWVRSDIYKSELTRDLSDRWANRTCADLQPHMQRLTDTVRSRLEETHINVAAAQQWRDMHVLRVHAFNWKYLTQIWYSVSTLNLTFRITWLLTFSDEIQDGLKGEKRVRWGEGETEVGDYQRLQYTVK